MSQNPSNPKEALLGDKSWMDTTVTQAQLDEIRREYHLYDGLACGVSAEDVLRKAGLDITPESIANEVMVVFEVQLKSGLRLPPSPFLTRLCEVWGVSPGQLVPNTFTMVNAFCVACYLINVPPLPDVFLQFYRLVKPGNHVMFSLIPLRVKTEGSGVGTKVGCFADCKDSWGAWKNRYFFILRDNSWGFRSSFVKSAVPGAHNRPVLYEGSDEVKAFVSLCHFMTSCMEDKVMDVRFPFNL